MDYSWGTVAELMFKLRELLSARHPDEVTTLHVEIEGDTVVLMGEVASEGCRGDAKRLALAFDGVMKVTNRLVVAAFLVPASDTSDEDDFFERSARRGVERRSDGSTVDRQLDEAFTREIRTKGTGSRHDGLVKGLIPDGPRIDSTLEPEPGTDEVSRYPSVAKTGQLVAGATISVSVNLSVEDAGDGEAMRIATAADDWSMLEVTVQISGDWIASASPEVGSITLRRDSSSDPAVFACEVSDDYVAGTPAEILVYYVHGTRICGHLRKDLADSVAPAKPATPAPTPAKPVAGPVVIDRGATGPTMSVMIAQSGSARQDWSWIAYVPGGTLTGKGTVELEGSAKSFSDVLLAGCPGLADDKFRRTMLGMGEMIWNKTPSGFRECYAACRAAGPTSFPIQFATDDPYVPWEMMRPIVEGLATDHLYLDHPVARWPLSSKWMRSAFGVGDILSFVPDYQARPLASAAAEGSWICTTLNAVRMAPTRASFLELLDGNRSDKVRLIHFAGHGTVDTGINDGGIKLQDGEVGVMEVNQSSVQIGRRDGPLVVLNACEASAGAEMLGMNTGWGAAIAAREFGGLIAPLWAVKDSMAFAIAQATLPALVTGDASLGEAVAAARKANADVSVAALAYLAHGDVMARFAKS